MTPDQNLLYGRPYTDAVSTDIRHTFARFDPKWAALMKHPQLPLPVATVTVHHKPKGY